ncbi:Avr1b-1 Avirulence-like protein [Phytophthora palmivora]|uniref:RING-type E3 ubiquitin transferase n=1 Tax=Phytophthora palmivora TaxID=4796 RepID=A0A2P4Y935_9STRA|nr:Avr1b-1 Avirulence-like protein [Phytophthora palmivora]
MTEATCVLCCNAIDNASRFNTVGVCNHKGCCSICALRLRQLLGQTSCVMCKTDMPRVICVQHEDESFESFQDWGDNIGPAHVFDEPSGVFFLKEDYAKRIRKLRDPLCKKCGKKFATVAALRTHVLDVHGLQYCSICLENKKVFLEELELYTKDQLKKHNTKGNPREGFMGHPRCDFCFSRFYSTTELYEHLRKNHFECDICLYQLNVQNRYYKDYNDLENHFRADHFLCEERECLAKKFVVFKSHLDLQAHMTVDHPHIKTSRKIDVHFTVRRASNADEDEFQDPRLFDQQSSGNHTINVADFPSLSGSDSAAAGSSFSLWENQTVTHRPRVEDFPALASSSSSNRSGSTFRNALAPPPSAALRAHMDNNGWEYESPDMASAAAVLGANNPLLGVLKPARKNNKGRKKGRKSGGGLEEKLATPAPVAQEEESESEDDEPVGPAPSKTAVVLKIRQVLGSDAKYEVFREECKRFRMGETEVPDFYAKMRDMFSPADFSQLFLSLMRLSPDQEQVDTFFAYHKQVSKKQAKAQGFQESTSKRNKKTTKQAELEQKAPTPRRKNQRQPPAPSQSGWGNALKESGVKAAGGRKPAAIVHNTNMRAMLGRDTQPTTQWSSSGSWQAPPPAASSASAYPALGRTPTSTKFQSAPIDSFASLSVSAAPSSSSGYGAAASAYASTPTPVLRQVAQPPAAPSFKTAKSDFPELPKAAKPIGVQPVTRATWDDQVQAIAQNRVSNSTNGGRGNGKKKQKKKSMSLQEMAMHFG